VESKGKTRYYLLILANFGMRSMVMRLGISIKSTNHEHISIELSSPIITLWLSRQNVPWRATGGGICNREDNFADSQRYTM